jgi:hypothetical protein
MRLVTSLQRLAFTGALLVAAVAPAFSQNVLTNPGFEAGFSGWTTFGNSFVEGANPPAVVPYAGNNVAKFFGGFSGGFSVSGFFQSYPAAPGQLWSLSSKSRHFSGDAMVGSAIPSGGNGNWVVQKLIFRANGVDDIASAESIILDGTFATDTWFDNVPVLLVAPPTTTTVWAFLLYLQPAFDGGAAQIDNVTLERIVATPNQKSSWSRVKSLYR